MWNSPASAIEHRAFLAFDVYLQKIRDRMVLGGEPA